jgi:16S rRNA (uracil1498-N3)-methyltransferase
VYVDAALAGRTSIAIEGDAAAHLMRVLRLSVGDAVTLFDGRGGEYAARIAGRERRGVQVELGEHRAIERESPLDLALVQSVARGERMDLIVRKATELGVTRIVPVSSERSVVRLAADQSAKKAAHWRAVAIAACEQCGRNRVPEVEQPQPLARVLEGFASHADTPGVTRLLLDPEATTALPAQVCHARQIVLLVGPEGGLADEEVAFAARAGFRPSRLGPRILRTETAAVASIAVIQAVAGDLGI